MAIASNAPTWATAVPNAPVQQPPAKAYQFTAPSASMTEGLQGSWLESILQQVVLAVQNLLLPNTPAFNQLQQWAQYLEQQAQRMQQLWVQFQSVINAIVGEIDADVNDLIAILQDTTTNATTAAGFWQTLFEDLGLGGLPELSMLLGDIQASSNALTVLLRAVWNDVIAYAGNWPELIAALEAAWNTYVTTVTPIISSEVATLQDIVAALLGLSPSELQTLQADFSALGTEYNAARSAFNTFLTSVYTIVTTEYTDWPVMFADLEAAWNTYVAAVTPIEAEFIATLEQIVAALLGISPEELQTLNGLFTTLRADYVAGQEALHTLLSSVWSTIESGGSFTADVDAIEAAWSTYITTITTLTEGEFATLTDIISALTGINPTALATQYNNWVTIFEDLGVSSTNAASYATMITGYTP